MSSNPEIASAGPRETGPAGTGPHRMRRLVLALALLVMAFAALYPCLEATGSCGKIGCPKFSHAHTPAPAELPAGALVAVLAAVPTLAGRTRLRPASDRRPAEVYLSLDPEPPRP